MRINILSPVVQQEVTEKKTKVKARNGMKKAMVFERVNERSPAN